MVRIAHQFAAWGVQADFAAVASHPAELGFTRTRLPFSSLVFSFLSPGIARVTVVVNAVVVLAQHREVRGFGVSAVLVRVDMVNLAPIG